MKLTSNVKYAHPVISEATDDFVNAEFSCELLVNEELDLNSGKLLFDYQLVLEQSEIAKLVENQTARACLMVECGATFYRSLEKLEAGAGTIALDASNLYKTIELTPVIFAAEDIGEYSPGDIHPEYGDSKFKVRAGDSLAIAPTQRYSVGNERQNYLESVFKFVTDEELDDFELDLSIDGEHIEISANTATREAIQSYRVSSEKKAILLNSIYLPVVVSVISEMTKDLASEHPTLSEKRWFVAFTELADENDFHIDKDSSPLDIAQKVLKYPFRSLVNYQESN